MIFPLERPIFKVMKPGSKSHSSIFPALAVAARTSVIVEGGGLSSSATVRRPEGFPRRAVARPTTMIAIVGFVGNNAQRLFWHEQHAQSGFHQLHFGGRSGFCVDGGWKAMSVSKYHVFAAPYLTWCGPALAPRWRKAAVQEALGEIRSPRRCVPNLWPSLAAPRQITRLACARC